MNATVEKSITRFLRTYDKPFTVSDVNSILKSFGEKIDKEEILDFLDNDDRVLSLNGRYYLTRAAAFTGMYFSFVPTQQELDQTLFIPGDRCLPFVDSEILSCQLKFVYKDKILSKKTIEIDCNTARDLFTFFGDEYSSQYIAADPVNTELNLAGNNFELPPKLKMTGISLERIFEDSPLKKGDRILCKLLDWDKGIIEICPILEHQKNPFILNSELDDRRQWNTILENSLLSCFEKMGPCKSIEQQLCFAFFESKKNLCTSACGSIHEFLAESKKISMELFGVETRLWKKGEDVPAVGSWNKDFLNYGLEACFPSIEMPACLIDCLIKDQLYEKIDDISMIIKKVLPGGIELSEDEMELFTLQIMSRSAILRKHYNWFADFATGALRHKALDLYSKVGDLFYEIAGVGDDIEEFPQQELVTLSQLYTHISRILELLTGSADCKEDDKLALKLSLEGMECNFEDIRPELMTAIDKFRSKQFKVI
ncbi:hypothetical protein [Treponema pectinovorum]|uniref:hypothetical protein n=1 Tax=Treponema pectinovorum TaxID=164 RepID=UPI003D90492E